MRSDFARNVAIGVCTLLIVQWITKPPVVVIKQAAAPRPKPLRAVIDVKKSEKPS